MNVVEHSPKCTQYRPTYFKHSSDIVWKIAIQFPILSMLELHLHCWLQINLTNWSIAINVDFQQFLIGKTEAMSNNTKTKRSFSNNLGLLPSLFHSTIGDFVSPPSFYWSPIQNAKKFFPPFWNFQTLLGCQYGDTIVRSNSH